MSKLQTLSNAQDERRRSNNHNKNKQIILLSHLKAETCLLDNTVQEILIILISISALLFICPLTCPRRDNKKIPKGQFGQKRSKSWIHFSMFLSSIWWSKQTLCKHHISAKVCLTTSTTCSIQYWASQYQWQQHWFGHIGIPSWLVLARVCKSM